MSSKHPEKDAPEQSTKNQLQKSSAVDQLYSLGQLSHLKSQNRSQGPPLSRVYLQQSSNNGTNFPPTRQPPPLPSRGTNASRFVNVNGYRYPAVNPAVSGYTGMNNYSGLGSMYSPYSSRYTPGLYTSGLYSSPYSNYRMPYGGHFGAPNDAYSSFLQMAEESTRPAFQSIESVVHVVNSISMMLESTYGAVHSSYSAILGVVDQFSRLKDHLAEVFSLFAMIRGLHWLCLKVLYLLKLRKTNPSVEAAWNRAKKASSGGYPESNGPAWPFFVFLSIIIGAPWLMFKLLSRNVTKKPFDPNIWLMPNGKRMLAYGAYDFIATQPGELSFRAGEKIYLNPKNFQAVGRTDKQWLHACNEREETGLVPMNYLLVTSNYLKTGNNGNNKSARIITVPENETQGFPKTYLDDPAFSEESAVSSEDTPMPRKFLSKAQPSAEQVVSAPQTDNMNKNVNFPEVLNFVTDSDNNDKEKMNG